MCFLAAFRTPGNMLSLTDSAPAVNVADAVGNTTTWRYDKRNRMQFEDIVLNSATPLVLTSRENQYYLNDTVQWTKDRDFNWIEYKYNFVMGNYQVGQERWWKTGVNYINDINYQYNDPKGLLLTDVYERAPGTTQVNNHIEFDYDGLARATKVRTYLTGNGAVAAQGGVVAVAASAVSTTFDVDHTWDSSDRRDLTAFYFNDQTTTLKKQEFRNDYTWDKLHRLDLVTQQVSSGATSWVVDAARTKSADFDYYPNSQLKKLTRLQGANTTALITDYKQNSPDDWWVPGRISKVEHSGLATGTQITSNDFDVSGRIIQKVTPAQTYNYAYDGTDQLTTVTNAGGSTLQDPNFNAVGNDTSHTVSYYNRVLNDGTYTYEYNNEGSRTKRTKIIGASYEVYAYDHRQRLTSVKSYTLGNVETSDVRYEYDALDRRFRRKVDTNNNDSVFEVNQRLLYDTNPVNPEFDEVVEIIDDSTGNRQHRFLNGPQPDMVLTDEVFNGTGTPTDILWLLQDHQNTVTDVATIPTSGSATLRNHLEYNAFGQITSQTNAAYAPVQTYTGQILDTATGLLYYDARWYDPQLGRFVSQDRSGFGAGDTNLSRMVGNSFPNAVDPSGLDEILNPDGSVSSVSGSNSLRSQQGVNPFGAAGNTTIPPEFLPPTNQQNTPYSRPKTYEILRPGEQWRLFYIFAFDAEKAQYVVRHTGANGTASAASVAANGICVSGSSITLHPIEHVLNEHLGGPTPYVSASTLPKGAQGFAGEPVWIDVTKLNGNKTYSYEEIVKMSEDFLKRNPHLKQRFNMWKAAQATEGEFLIKGNIRPNAISTKGAIRCKNAIRVGGKALFLAAVAIDTNAFIESERKSKELSRIAGGWTGAWAGGKVGSVGGAIVGVKIAGALGFAGPQAAAPEELITVPAGATVGAIIGGGLGSMAGYGAGSQAGVNYYNFINGEF